MGYTVFFSWQSDRPSREGRSLIETALEDAVKRIAADASIDEPYRELSVDKDTKNVPGSPRIFETILSKIEQASAFVADLTYCGNRVEGGPTPNPNVLIEYGYALKALGENRVISVMNSAYGEASRESMPFDLLTRRYPISYSLRDDSSETERRECRRQLSKRIEDALRAVFTDLSDQILPSLGIDLPRGRRSLDFLPELNPKEIEILALTKRDQAGQLFRVRSAGRERLAIGKVVLFNSNDARSRAEWIAALEDLVSLGLLEIRGQKGEFYQLTGSGYGAADLLDDFARWSASQVTVEARYVGAPADSLTLPCSGIVQLPATYYEVRVRADVDVMRSEKEPKSLLIEGIPLRQLNEIPWKPTHLTFVETATNETKTFLVERTDNRKVPQFYLTS